MHEVLSNGLQNAMKACENMDREAARFVDVRAHRAGTALVISIRNSCSGVLGIEDRIPDRTNRRPDTASAFQASGAPPNARIHVHGA